jgi:outer membrane protein OmpA-like peptidoglycan-associated protein
MNREWMSISDMMSGLMLIFLFISISFMVKVETQKQEMKDVAVAYRDTKVNLNEALFAEFEEDFKNWNATITEENAIVFNAPETLFPVNRSEIKDKFKTILEEFFPRYIEILTSNAYIDKIREIRVEGHTSDEWKNSHSIREKYLKNMQLSQARAFNVLSYCYLLNKSSVSQNLPWLEKYFRANGMSYSQMQNRKTARRVEFVVRMKSEDSVYEVLEK